MWGKNFLCNFENFYNNLGIHAVVIYFCFVLIGLINDYKNIYSHNVCTMVFMWWFLIEIVSIG